MPRIDPTKLLECLKILLSPSGGIKSSLEVKRLANLMTKFSKKLVSKCIYIEILKCSETDLLCQFMQAGGWTLVHLWLTDAINSANWPLVHEILELLLLCPVDVERLKSNNLPKLVKQMTKDEHPGEVKLLAETLVQQWLKIVRGEGAVTNASSDVTSENETSQDVPVESEKVLKTTENEEKVEKQEKIVLKLSVKDGGKNVIIKRSDSQSEANALTEKSSTETAEESEETDSVTTDSKADETEKEKKHEKERKKSSSSSSKSSSHKSSHHSSSHKSSSSSSSSKHKSSSSSREKERDKKSHHKSSSSKSKSSSSRTEKERKRDKEPEMSEADKVAKTLAELEPEKLTKLGKIPKKPRESVVDDKKTTKPVPAPIVPKVKPTFSIEERDPEKKAKTVKTLNSKFRSHGLEEEAPPPPSRNKVLKKQPTQTPLPPPVLTTGIKRVSPPRTSIGKDPALSPPVEKKPKLTEENRPNGIKPKPKSHTLVETDLFSDALNMESTSRKRAIDAKKRKRRLSASDKTPQSPTTPTTPTNGIPMKFYQDTLEDGEKGTKDRSPENSENDKDGEVSKTKKLRHSTSLDDEDDVTSVIQKEEEAELEVIEKRPPGIGTGPDGPPGILKVFNARSKKKSIQWRAQEELVEIRYFELDVTERVNVNRQFSECRQAEIMLEREKMLQARNLPKEDFMEAKTSWTQLIEIDGVPKHPNGEQSTERRTQQERERAVLPALWNIAMLPMSPTEPDHESNVTFVEPKIIPIDDLTGNPEGVNDFTHMAWPDSKGEAPLTNLNSNNLNPFGNLHNQFPNTTTTPYQTNLPTNLQQPPPNAGPWANAPPAILGALAQPPPFVDPAINPLAAAFNHLPGNQFLGLPPGVVPPLANNFSGPPPINFQNNHAPPPRNDRNNWIRGNADRNSRWNDRDRRNYHSDRDRRDNRDNRRDDRDRGRPGVCRQFVKYGNCRQGDKCIYYHPVR